MKLLRSVILLVFLAGCDKGLEPTSDIEPEGNLIVNITYEGDWPPPEAFLEYRFVGFDFFPEEVTDILFNLENLIISEERPLHGVESETIVFENISNRTIIYSALAWQHGPNIFEDWQAAGETREVYTIEGNTVEIDLHVDFDNLPPFPPEP